MLLLTGCFCLHPESTLARQAERAVNASPAVSKNFKDTTVLIQGIFVKMRLYLPDDYQQKKKKFPVIYIINTDSAFVLNEEMSDTLSSVQKEYPAAIIIELKNFGKGFGDADVTEIGPYILNTKKYIDKTYPVLSDAASAIITGYRKCAPVAVQLTLCHPELFGRSGIFLADFSLFPEFDQWMNEYEGKMDGMMFLHSFDKDRSENGKILNTLMDQIGSHSKGLLYNFLDTSPGNDNKNLSSFLEFYKWILSNGHNYIIRAQEKIKITL